MDEQIFDGSLVFTGGGTGGHYYPALALAEAARDRWPERPVAFVGALRGIEARLLPESPWPHWLLDVEGFVGGSPLRALRAACKLAVARGRLKAAWRRHRPWAVVGTGGYGAGPALLAARALGIPYFLHESNAQPGQLVKLLASRAAGVWCGMDAVRSRLPGSRCLLAGTPVRAAFRRDFLPLARLVPPRRLLVLGGSGGAQALNSAVADMAPALLEHFPDWEILHQTGAAGYPLMAGRQLHPRHRISPFLDPMDRELEAASLVLSRSGASTCAELKASGRPALLVPMPGSAGGHQAMNAQAMVDEGRALLVAQGPDLAAVLGTAAAGLMADPDRLGALSRPAANQAETICLDDLAAAV